MDVTEDALLEELAWEEEMRGMGRDRYRKQIERALKNDDTASTKPGLLLLSKAVDRLSAGFAQFFADCAAGKPGPKAALYVYMRDLDPDTLAFLTAKAVIDGIARSVSAHRVARSIGSTLQDELRFRAFNSQKPSLYKKIREAMLEERMASQERTSKLRKAFRAYAVEMEEWPPGKQALVGAKCLDLLLTHTDMAETYYDRSVKHKSEKKVRATPETLKLLTDVNNRCELMTPVYMPTLIPPMDWEEPKLGGYYSPVMASTLVKNKTPGYQRDLAKWEMPEVYSAVNALQRTPWQINREVYEVMNTLFEAGSEVGKLPASEDQEEPKFPEDRKDDREAVREWSRGARRVRAANEKRTSRRSALSKMLWVADKLQDRQSIYFPCMMDFRGRIYPRPLFLHPQGDDRCKALLRFSEGKPLGDENGACWLAVHGANCWGFDKVPLQDRIDWVTTNEERIKECATNPYDARWWTEADKPWCFLAFCYEWSGYLREGFGFLSALPVALDGSCNGLQHFGMALRCASTGAAVNLLPSATPEDIYQRVADRVLTHVEAAAQEGEEIAQQWISSGLITRKLCKKPVMTLPYGAKSYGMREGTCTFLEELIDEGGACPWPRDDLMPPAIWITKLIWDAINATVSSARAAMDFLQQTAQVASQEDTAIFWASPIGFPVVQRYPEMKLHMIKTQLQGEFVQFRDYRETTKIDKRRMSSGISPNFVHSLDASHMMMTINLATEQGVSNFAMIHDSYGTHACDTEVLSLCLREAFVEQYDADVLGEFLEQVKQQVEEDRVGNLPVVPQRGSLDPQEVLKSDFFFA